VRESKEVGVDAAYVAPSGLVKHEVETVPGVYTPGYALPPLRG